MSTPDLHRLFDLLQDAVLIVDARWSIRFQNKQARKVLGTDTTSLNIPELPTSPEPGEWEAMLLISDQLEDFRVRVQPLGEDSWAVFLTDLTPLNEALSELEKNYQKLTDGLPFFLIITDQNGMVTYQNNRAQSFFGVCDALTEILSEDPARSRLLVSGFLERRRHEPDYSFETRTTVKGRTGESREILWKSEQYGSGEEHLLVGIEPGPH